jgi:hypothetical protein
MTDRSKRAIITGENGEKAVKRILVADGWDVTRDHFQDWDLCIEGVLTVEVKTAYLSGRTDSPCRRWQFCLYAHKDRQQPVNEDLLVLRCEYDPPCHFVIPTFVIPPGLTKIDITNPNPWEYRGKWSLFRERWEFVGLLLPDTRDWEFEWNHP